jgi:hypothetical protein
MNQSAIDSIQVAIINTIIAIPFAWDYKTPLFAARILTLLINVPLIFVGGFGGYGIANLFLLTNMISLSTLFPVLIGMVTRFETFISGTVALLASLSAIFSVMVYGFLKVGNWSEGIYTYFYLKFSWESFTISLLTSIIATFLFASIEFVIRKIIDKPLKTPIRKEKTFKHDSDV